MQRLEASGFPRPHAWISRCWRRLQKAPGSGQAAAPKGQHPPAMAPGTACSQPRGSRDFSLSHGAARGTRCPGELCAVSFLAGSSGENRREQRLCSRAVLSPKPQHHVPWQAGQCGHSHRGAWVPHSIRQKADACPWPAPSRHKGPRNVPPRPARASLALDVLLLGG